MKASEHEEQVALFRWAEYAVTAIPELCLLYAIPNGGHRHKAVAARLKAEGVKPGVPDVCLPVARGGWHGLYIEMKTERGRASKAQLQWLCALREEGYKVAICRGWETARGLIEDYLCLHTVAGGMPAEEQSPARSNDHGEYSHSTIRRHPRSQGR